MLFMELITKLRLKIEFFNFITRNDKKNKKYKL